jgi:hypothetical protein
MSAENFPFKRAWDLNSKDLMFYITMDQVLDHKWTIEKDLYNDPKDEVYVLGNIMKDEEEIEKLERKT